MNPDQQDRMSAYLDRCRAVIAKYGWMVQGVFPTVGAPGVSFSYTAGLCVAGLPELVVVGLRAEVATTFLNALARRALTEEPVIGAEWTVDENPDLVWRLAPVEPEWARENVTMPRRLFPTATVTAVQALWPDKAGAHPGTPAWSLTASAQPLLADYPGQDHTDV